MTHRFQCCFNFVFRFNLRRFSKECAERRRLQATIDGMISELEQRAPLLSEQRAEYERAVSAHGEMRLRLEVGPANHSPRHVIGCWFFTRFDPLYQKKLRGQIATPS